MATKHSLETTKVYFLFVWSHLSMSTFINVWTGDSKLKIRMGMTVPCLKDIASFNITHTVILTAPGKPHPID